MPWAPKKPCPRCGRLTTARYCERHQAEAEASRKVADERRGSASSRGYDRQWRKARSRYLAEHPLCVQCLAEGRVTSATIVDHIIPHKGDRRLFWDEGNWQSLCKSHHDAKTAREDGGLGRPVKGEGGGKSPRPSRP